MPALGILLACAFPATGAHAALRLTPATVRLRSIPIAAPAMRLAPARLGLEATAFRPALSALLPAPAAAARAVPVTLASPHLEVAAPARGPEPAALGSRLQTLGGELRALGPNGSSAVGARLDQVYLGGERGTGVAVAVAPPSAPLASSAELRLPAWASPSFQGARAVAAPGPRPYLKRLGASLIDTRAPGAGELLASLDAMGEGALVLGTFDARTGEILNAFAWGRDGILYHQQALPPEPRPESLGGYTLMLRGDGAVQFKASGSLFQPLTPRIQRAILRHMGVSPADEGLWSGLGRRALNAVDAAFRSLR